MTTPDRQSPSPREKPRPPRGVTETMVFGEPDGRQWLAWVMKRTYRIRNGRCELDDPGRQEMLQSDELPHDRKRQAPLISPPLFTGDLFAFRPRTDVVIQAFAHAYQPSTRKLTASLQLGKHLREIVVYGDRFGDVDGHGRLRFSEPGPIDVVPIRYDYAYGGVDLGALKEFGNPIGDFIRAQRPDFPASADTPFHYPRNPCGFGYLMELDARSFKGLPIPHLEHPGDPLWPQRLAVGEPAGWINGPLPAGWDWQSQGWFPRIAYLGLAPACSEVDKPPVEVKRGWAARDILAIPPLYQAPEAPLRLEFGQGASPGMSFDDIAPDETFELRNLHPQKQVYSFRMPGEVPSVQLELKANDWLDLTTHLDSVVVRPVPGEIVVVWSARAPMPPGLTPDQALELRRRVSFQRPRES